MLMRDRQSGLSRMLALSGHAVQEQGTAGDGFVMFVGTGQTDKEQPPVVDKRDHATDQAAALDVLCGIAAPAPLVFQFVQAVFGVGAVPIELGNGESL